MASNTRNEPRGALAKLTVTAPADLIESVQQHRRDLQRQTGLRVSTSSVVNALIRAGLKNKADAQQG